MKARTIVGAGLSVIWLCLLAALLWTRRGKLITMELNAIGDLTAGAFAPLAFLWLVIGYRQQGEELEANTRALEAQQAELARQVEETKALAKASDRQASTAEAMAAVTVADMKRREYAQEQAARPVPKMTQGNEGNGMLVTQVTNSGARVSNVRISGPEGFEERLIQVWDAGEPARLKYRAGMGYPFVFNLSYLNQHGAAQSIQFEMIGPHSFRDYWSARC